MRTFHDSRHSGIEHKLNEEINFSLQGLNFSIHADAAWGAYFSCMFREHYDPLMAAKEGFVPELQLNSHVTEQLKALNQCDTITVDPHKSGFCPYPAGAICYRNQDLNNFLSLTSDVVYYHGNINFGDLGLEGSKPGAAAAGVLLANRVSSRKMSSLLAQQEKNILKKSIALKIVLHQSNRKLRTRIKGQVVFFSRARLLIIFGLLPSV